MTTTVRIDDGVTVHGRTPSQWAETALLNAMNRAADKDTEKEATETLLRGVRTAEKWLTGTHPALVG